MGASWFRIDKKGAGRVGEASFRRFVLHGSCISGTKQPSPSKLGMAPDECCYVYCYFYRFEIIVVDSSFSMSRAMSTFDIAAIVRALI